MYICCRYEFKPLVCFFSHRATGGVDLLFSVRDLARRLVEMGGAVSSGESNDDLVDNLMAGEYVKVGHISHEFRLFFYEFFG